MSNKIKFIIVGALVMILLIAIILIQRKQVKLPTISKSPTSAKILDNQILWPRLSNNQREIYYFSNSKTPAFYKSNLENKETTKISSDLDTPNEIIWSPDLSKAIIQIYYDKYVFEKYDSPFKRPETPDQSLSTWVYDFKVQKLIDIDININNLVWINNDQIMYDYLTPDSIEVYSANYDNSHKTKITELALGEVKKFIGFNNNNLYYIGSSGEGTRNLSTLNIDDQNISLLIDGAEDALLSNDGKSALLEKTTDEKTSLLWSSTEKVETKDTNLEGMVAKSAWINSSSFITAITEGSRDQFYLYDTVKNKKDQINNKAGNTKIDENSLMVSSDGKTIYFIVSHYLYKITL